MDWGKRIGANLKQMRTERNLTLGQLSGLAGISKAMLSEMEKGMGNPTINTIWKIANGLKVPYTRLLEGSEPGPTLVRREELSPQTEGNGHYRVYCYFQGGPERSFELFYMELDPHTANTSPGHLGPGTGIYHGFGGGADSGDRGEVLPAGAGGCAGL